MKKLMLLVLPWHLLTWSDFKGTPKTDHAAYSAMSIGFEYTDLGDGHVIFEDAAVEFLPESSYTNTNDPYILNHEQGHVNICQIQVNYINNLSHIHHIHYRKDQFEAMKNEMTRRWNRMDDAYDKETDNSINHKEQDRWDIYIAKQLIMSSKNN